MTQEDKQLLLQDLCARLPYDVKIYTSLYGVITLNEIMIRNFRRGFENALTPYLRPMSSITEEEKEEFNKIKESVEVKFINAINDSGFTLAYYELIDWLNKHHFDYRGLIFRDLALEAKEGMYDDSFT